MCDVVQAIFRKEISLVIQISIIIDVAILRHSQIGSDGAKITVGSQDQPLPNQLAIYPHGRICLVLK
ncbi:MAG: hypothetical protein DI538_18135 [Azospira oryzae]|nr:MAG: hypothetical protein DI538_18135 [Azospira oryzae]